MIALLKLYPCSPSPLSIIASIYSSADCAPVKMDCGTGA